MALNFKFLLKNKLYLAFLLHNTVRLFTFVP